MLIAQDKKKKNIAEYILYIWQLEDIMRAFKFDMELINQNIVKQYTQNSEQQRIIYNWYESLVRMMHEENIKDKGHLIFIKNTLNDLYDLHLRLLKAPEQVQYRQAYETARPHINEFIQKAGNTFDNELHACFTSLYGTLLLRLQQKTISKETHESVDAISRYVAQLSKAYHDYEAGKIDVPAN